MSIRRRWTTLQIGGNWHVFDHARGGETIAIFATRKEARDKIRELNDNERAQRIVGARG